MLVSKCWDASSAHPATCAAGPHRGDVVHENLCLQRHLLHPLVPLLQLGVGVLGALMHLPRQAALSRAGMPVQASTLAGALRASDPAEPALLSTARTKLWSLPAGGITQGRPRPCYPPPCSHHASCLSRTLGSQVRARQRSILHSPCIQDLSLVSPKPCALGPDTAHLVLGQGFGVALHGLGAAHDARPAEPGVQSQGQQGAGQHLCTRGPQQVHVCSATMLSVVSA